MGWGSISVYVSTMWSKHPQFLFFLDNEQNIVEVLENSRYDIAIFIFDCLEQYNKNFIRAEALFLTQIC